MMVKLDDFSDLMICMNPPEWFPEKNLFGHTPVGLFFGRKLIYFSVLYYGIGEISGILPEK
jgi:hypothetical protein